MFGFKPESLFDFPPECCSDSARNGVRLNHGIVFGLGRNSHTKPLSRQLKKYVPQELHFP